MSATELSYTGIHSVRETPPKETLTVLNVPPAEETVDNFLNFLRAKGRSPITIGEYRPRILELFAFTGKANVAEITKGDVVKFTESMAGRSDSMHNLTAFSVRKFLRWAYINDFNEKDLSHFVATRKIPKKLPEEEYVWLTFQEQQKFIAACSNLKEQLVIMFPLKTGVRNGRHSPRREFCGIHWEDIDLDRRLVKIYGKGPGVKGKIRYVRFDDATKNLLEKYRAIGGKMPINKKKHINTKIIREVARRAGIEKLATAKRPFHALKHTFCTSWVLARRIKNMQENLRELSNQVGTDIKTLEVYIHIADELLKSSYDETMKMLAEMEATP